jgi:transposase
MKHELTEAQRAAILAYLDCGYSQRAVARLTGVARSTVRDTLYRWQNHHTVTSRARHGRPRLLSRRASRRAFVLAKRYREWTWNLIKASLGLTCHTRTLRQTLQAYRLYK